MKILCVFNNSLQAARIKYATGRRITIWALKQNGIKMSLKVQYHVIWYPKENLLHLYKSCLHKIKYKVSPNFS